MPIYKNKTDKILSFRANDKSGRKVIVTLPPDTEFESDREVKYSGLEETEKKTKKSKESDD